MGLQPAKFKITHYFIHSLLGSNLASLFPYIVQGKRASSENWDRYIASLLHDSKLMLNMF